VTAAGWSAQTRAALMAWIGQTLSPDALDAVVPELDPLRTWWAADGAGAAARLVDLLVGGNDHLTLFALVQRARLISPPPAELDERLSVELAGLALAARTAPVPAADVAKTFLCYAHEDMDRVVELQRLLAAAGVRTFRDVEQIRPGESITTGLHQAMSTASSAVLVISRFSESSEWARRERAHLLARRKRDKVLVLPVLIDDVALPDEIADVFTIDLRGYRGEPDDNWADARLAPLVRRLTQADGRAPAETVTQDVAGVGRLTYRIESSRRILDDFFQVDESYVRFQRFDRSMAGPVRCLRFVRRDSAAAVMFNRQSQEVILVQQFRYPATAAGAGWGIELVAGSIDPGETPEAGVRREIAEETGYQVDVVTPITTFFLSPGGSTERTFLFYTEVVDSDQLSTSGGLAGDNEDVRIVRVPVDQVAQLLDDGELADAKTIIGLRWLLDSPMVGR
jgi:ADP-ribose pyrophosphatase